MIRVDGSNGIADIIVGAAIAVWIKRKLSVGEISLAMLVRLRQTVSQVIFGVGHVNVRLCFNGHITHLFDVGL